MKIDTVGRSPSQIEKRYTVSINGGEARITQRLGKEKKSREENTGGWYYLGAIGQIGFTISIPIAGGAFIGSYLDRSWGTYPKATLSCLFFGIVISGVNFYQTVKNLMKK